MFKFIEVRDSHGKIIAEAPLILHDGPALDVLLRKLAPMIIAMYKDTGANVLQFLWAAIDTAKGEGALKMPVTDDAHMCFTLIMDDPAPPENPPIDPDLLN